MTWDGNGPKHRPVLDSENEDAARRRQLDAIDELGGLDMDDIHELVKFGRVVITVLLMVLAVIIQIGLILLAVLIEQTLGVPTIWQLIINGIWGAAYGWLVYRWILIGAWQ